MLLSTAIPIVIAAIVIVIISNEIPKMPIKPRINVEAKILGIIPAQLSLNDLNKKINIMNINIKTKPKDFICELNNDWSMLL